MITIDQLLESVDLDFEPKWVTQNKRGYVCIWERKPEQVEDYWDINGNYACVEVRLKLSEFENKDWTECIYEVPRKAVISKMETTGEIEKIAVEPQERFEPVLKKVIETLNTVVDAVNELKGE